MESWKHFHELVTWPANPFLQKLYVLLCFMNIAGNFVVEQLCMTHKTCLFLTICNNVKSIDTAFFNIISKVSFCPFVLPGFEPTPSTWDSQFPTIGIPPPHLFLIFVMLADISFF